MQEKLIIYLHADALDNPSWAIVSDDRTVRQSAYRDEGQGLAQIAENKEIIVIIPGEDVLLTTTQLPKMSRSKLAQAIPFALEEQLVADVETLHFATGVHQPDGNLPVAIVAKAKIEQYLALLKSWHLTTDVLIPTIFALPLIQDAWQVLIDDVANVRTGFFAGFACDKENLSNMLDLAMNAVPSLPKQIHIQHTQDEGVSISDMPIEIQQEKIQPNYIVNIIADGLDKTPYINLLQGAYTVKKSRFPQMAKLWKTAAYLACAWIILLFLYPTVSYFILQQRVTEINNQIAQIYQRHFPQANSVIAPKLRMEDKLQKLNGQAGENHLLVLLGDIGKGMAKTQSIKLKRLDFQNNQLTVDLTAATSEDFSAFTNFLSNQGLNVKQQNADLAGSHINATLQIG